LPAPTGPQRQGQFQRVFSRTLSSALDYVASVPEMPGFKSKSFSFLSWRSGDLPDGFNKVFTEQGVYSQFAIL